MKTVKMAKVRSIIYYITHGENELKKNVDKLYIPKNVLL